MSSRGGSPPHQADCVIVGAGVVGASIAQRLAREGQRVVVVDGAADVGGGCSYANAAIIAPDHVAPLATPAMLREAPGHMLRRPPSVSVRPGPRLVPWLASLAVSALPARARRAQQGVHGLAERSTDLHRRLHEQGLSPGFTKTGALDVHLRAPSDRTGDWLEPAELRRIEPGVGAAVAGGQHHVDEWTLESRQYTRAMLEDARNHGAEVHFDQDVQEVIVEGDRVRGVRTSSMTVLAESTVLAAGLGVRPLAAQVGLHIPLRGGRGYVIDLASAPGDPVMPVRLKDRRLVVTPLADRVRISGSMEFGRESRPARRNHAQKLRAVASVAVPSLAESRVIEEWVGERPCVPDGVPVIGSSDRVGGLQVAAGHGMWGMILAPVTAELVSEAISNGAQGTGAQGNGAQGTGAQGERGWLHPDRFTSPSRRAQRALS